MVVPVTEWFSGVDLAIDIFSAGVLLILLIYSWRYFKIHGEQKKYKYLVASFLLLTISFLSEVLTHFTIYYQTTQTRQTGLITVTMQTLQSSSVLVYWGAMAYHILSLLGLYLFYLNYTQDERGYTLLLVLYLLIVVGHYSQFFYYLFHITSLLLLLIITRKLFLTYQRNKFARTKMLAWSFAIISLSQGVFIFTGVNQISYIVAEIIQLAGYSLLLATFFKVFLHGKKTPEN